METLGLEMKFTDFERDIIIENGNLDKKLQFPPYLMNFGVSVRPQQNGLVVKRPNKMNSIPVAVFPKYDDNFFGMYIKRQTAKVDQYHQNRKDCARLQQMF